MNVDGTFEHLIFEFLVLDICIERLRHSVTTSAQIPYMDRRILFCTVFVLAGQPIGRL